VLEPPGRSRASQAGYRRDQAGYRRDRDQAGYSRDRDQAGYSRDRDQRGYRPDRDEGGYPRNRDQGGSGPDRDQGGYPRNRDQAGYPRNRDQGSYPRDRDQPGHRRNRDQPGYPRDRDQGGYRRNRDQGSYPSDRDQGGYRRDQAGYPRDQAGLGRGMPEADAAKPRRMLGWGRYPARTGVLMVLAAALLGVAFTVATHRDPGLALGIFVAGGTVAAGISVRSRAAYTIIPVPALAYAAAAVIAGFIHDHATDTSHTALALSGAQWFADGFPAMAIATALAVLIAISRWLLGRLGKRSSRSDLARPHQPTRRGGPGRPAAGPRPDREDSSRASMTNFRQPGGMPPAARPSRRRPPPTW
jgi:hypothetical protein